jgi:hypothetical protein
MDRATRTLRADIIIQEYKIPYLFHPVRSALPISQPSGKRGWI